MPCGRGSRSRRATHGRRCAMAAPVEADPCAPEAARVRAAVAMAEALAVAAAARRPIAVARRWEPASQRQLAGAQALAHWLAGSLYEAADEAERAYVAPRPTPQGRAVAASCSATSGSPAATPTRRCAGSARARVAAARLGPGRHAPRGPRRHRPGGGPGGRRRPRGQGDRRARPDAPHRPAAASARSWASPAPGPPTSRRPRPRAIALATAVLATAEARGADGFAARARTELARLSRARLTLKRRS